jgi:hypothetical protein
MLVKHIAEDGHVFQYRLNPRAKDGQEDFIATRVGVNEASTFFGFCQKHDNEFFSPLEQASFAMRSDQIALLGYRALCRELYHKDAAISSVEMMAKYVKKHPELYSLDKEYEMHLMQIGHSNARSNLAQALEPWKDMISGHNYSELRYYAVEFDSSPVHFCAGAFSPEWDFEGILLQDLSRIEKFYPITFTAWAIGTCACAVFAWHKNADSVCRPYIASLEKINPIRTPNRLLSHAFEFCENVFFKQSWWNGLRRRDRGKLTHRVLSGMPHQSFERGPKSLMDDGLKALLYKSTRIECKFI